MRVSNRFMNVLAATATVLSVGALLLIVAAFYLYQLSLELPDFSEAAPAYMTPRTSVVYAADGSVLARWHGEQNRTVVALASMPSMLQNAVVAIEDDRFYEHDGVDMQAVMRAATGSREAGQAAQGTSTITQQLVGMIFAENERTIVQRIREMLLAYQLESKTDKDSVLEAYLNLVYFGQGAFGVEAAAQQYFGKTVSAISLSEAALLAGIISAPGRYSPVDAPDAARERRDAVLRKMRDLGMVSAQDAAEAIEQPVELGPPQDAADVGPYFVEWVRLDLIDRLGSEAVLNGGLRVHTTLDPAAQASAEQAVGGLLGQGGDPETAVVTLQPSTGRVTAMVGGRDFVADQFNLATQARRQPGSAFKTFVLVCALEEGVSPDRVYDARPYSVEVTDGVWNVQNYDSEATAASLSLRAATSWSINTVYARLIMQVGAEDVVKVARRMGIVSPLDPNPAIALGGLTHGVTPLEMAAAYGTIATGGLRVVPRGVDLVLDDRGEVVWRPVDEPQRVLDPAIARTTAELLHGVVQEGTGSAANFGTWAAGKTGTTQSYRDAWFVGWAGNMVTAVWVGHREGQVEMLNVRGTRVTGGSFPARIWRAHMERIPRSVDTTGSVGPPIGSTSARAEVAICQDTTLLANPRCPRTTLEMYEPTGIPSEVCTAH